ncbi:MAG TPA: hypothetical protein VE242_01410 [Chthoniobacterales bacterium]|nr:hypothetical protein [Chthoniobacterales bacterium]
MKIRRPGIVDGLFVATMLTAALIGIFFFAWRAAGLPFVPFDTFAWLTRVLPGRIIAFGIGTMVTNSGAEAGPNRDDGENSRTGDGDS